MEQDLLRLKGGLLSKADFIGSYGEEQYNKAIGIEASPPEPATPQPEEDESSFFGTLGEGIVDAVQGTVRGMIGAPVEAAETFTNLNSMGTEEANSLYQKSVDYRNIATSHQ